MDPSEQQRPRCGLRSGYYPHRSTRDADAADRGQGSRLVNGCLFQRPAEFKASMIREQFADELKIALAALPVRSISAGPPMYPGAIRCWSRITAVGQGLSTAVGCVSMVLAAAVPAAGQENAKETRLKGARLFLPRCWRVGRFSRTMHPGQQAVVTHHLVLWLRRFWWRTGNELEEPAHRGGQGKSGQRWLYRRPAMHRSSGYRLPTCSIDGRAGSGVKLTTARRPPSMISLRPGKPRPIVFNQRPTNRATG